MRYLPKPVAQMDGSKCEHFNCWAATGSWLADGSSSGDRAPEPTFFRFKAMKGGDECSTGGLADMERGLKNMDLWHHARYIPNVPRETLRRMLMRRTGYLVAMETSFEAWPDRDKCQPGYDGYHSVGVVCGAGKTAKTRGDVRTMDPLCKDYRWTDVDGVIAAAIQYNNEHSGEIRSTVDIIVLIPRMVR